MRAQRQLPTGSRVCLALLMAGILTGSARAETSYLGVVTIYNKTSIQLNYQLRVRRNGEWSKWYPKTHKYPRNGWHYHSFRDAEKIEIRFDRIGGDDEYTEKIYNLKFNRVDPDEDVCRHDGRPYRFQFDAGGRLLDLYRHHW